MENKLLAGLFLWGLALGGCKGQSHQPTQPDSNINTADTVALPYGTDSNVPIDTDDYNKNTDEEIALDSPSGPPDQQHAREISRPVKKKK